MHGQYTDADVERFWSKVNKDGPTIRPELGPCWLWTAGCNDSGYGIFFLKGRKKRAHRFSFALNNGMLPDEVCALHRCDVRRCVRPTHLFDGSRGDNLIDAISKGRHRAPRGPKGQRHSQAKLTDVSVAEIRRRYAQGGIYQRELAAEFGVDQSVISDVVRGRLWSHL